MRKKDDVIGVTEHAHAEALHNGISALMRQFKLETGMAANSPYADMHVNDIGLLTVLSSQGDWTVRGLAQVLSAPDSTMSSALDRLEKRKLVERSRLTSDKRVMGVTLTDLGQRLAAELREVQIENCHAMLQRLTDAERLDVLRLVSKLSGNGT